MKKNGSFNPLRNICLICVLSIGLMTIIGTGGGGSWVEPFWMYWSVGIADLNNDGHQDIAGSRGYFHSSNWQGDVSVLYQDSQNQGSFPFVRRIRTGALPYCISIDIGDLNGDGSEDVATACTFYMTSHQISITYQDPVVIGEFLPIQNISIGFVPSFLKIGDIDDDGFNDIVISASNTSVLYQDSNSPGSFLPMVSLNIGSSSVDIGDINGDNYLDLALTGEGQIRLLFQDSLSPGNFLSPVSITVGFQPNSIKIKDIDIDGKVDLIVGNYGKSDNWRTGSVSVLIQDFSEAGTFLPRIDYPLGRRAEDLAIGDLKKDLAIKLCKIHFSIGADGLIFVCKSQNADIRMRIFNNDGLEDIAVANGYTGGGEDSNGSIAILFQNVSSLGKFLSPVFYAGIFQPDSIAIGDLNGDSFNDIAFGDGSLAIRFQDSTNPGSFKQIIIVDE